MNRNEAIEAMLKPETGQCWSDNGHSNWRGVIAVGGTDFKALKIAAEEAMRKIAACKSLRDLRNINLSHSGSSDFHYFARFACPDEHRVAELRREADELEKKADLKRTDAAPDKGEKK